MDNLTKALVVEIPAMAPDWLSSTLLTRLFSILFMTRDSKVFAAMGFKEMGRRSVSTLLGGRCLDKGMTSEDFHKVGKTPSLNELL